MDYRDVLFPVVLFLVAFYVWTLPIQASPLPFGEGDAAWHFGIGDYIYSQDRTIDRLPSYIGYWYYLFNPVLGPLALEYPPSNHINYALMQVFGDGQFVPVYIYKAITSFLGVFAVYFLMKRLYGSIVGFVAGFGMIFSIREMLTYSFGQHPTLISIVIVPVLLYSLYMYLTSLYEEKPRNVYLVVAALLAVSQYLLHVQGLIVSAVVSFFFVLAMVIMHRRFPIGKINWLVVSAAIIVFLAFAIPFIQIYLGPASDFGERTGIGRLFSWTLDPNMVEGSYPPFYLSFPVNYSYFLLPFILAGIFFVVLRRKDQDILMISWIFGIYVVLHLDVFAGASGARVARTLIAEPQLFFSLAAIGAFYVPGLFSIPLISKQYLKLGFSFLMIGLVVLAIGTVSYSFISNAYKDSMRISQDEVNAALWIRHNLPEEAVIYNVGTGLSPVGSYPKMRFMQMVSQRWTDEKSSGFVFKGDVIYPGFNLTPTHYVFDYSEISKYGGNQPIAQQISAMRNLEMQLNGTKIYDRNNVRIYEVKNE